MKKFLVLILTVVVLASSFVMPSMAATEPTDIGGFDFYSITFHYSEPMVVGYVEKEREKLDKDGNVILNSNGEPKTENYYAFGDAVESYTIYTLENNENQVINVPYDSTTKTGEATIKKFKNNTTNFYAVSAPDCGVDSSMITYSKYPTPYEYFTQIQNNSALLLKDSTNIFGLSDLYSPEGDRNPNFVFKDNYFVDKNTKQRVDDNGFVLDDNNLWHTSDGYRVEPFILNDDGSLTWVSLDERTDDSGRIIANSKISDSVQLYCINSDTNGDGELSKKEIQNADDTKKVFTEADIRTHKNSMGIVTKVSGSPVPGVLECNASITSITIEIDALGTQLYSDVSADPQQKNTITITTGAIYENIKLAEEIVKKNPKKINDIGAVIGTAKCITTKTEMKLSYGAESTRKSITVDATPEMLGLVTSGVDFYLNFHVETLQPTDGINIADTYIANGSYFHSDGTSVITKDEFEELENSGNRAEKKNYNNNTHDSKFKLSSFTVYKITEADLGDAQSNLMLILIIVAAAVVVIAAVIIIIVVVSKKKKKSVAPVADDTAANADTETTAEPEATAEAETADENVAEENKED